MNVTTTYYRSLNNRHWFTRIGKFSFYSVTKPTDRQLRRWKKQVKGISYAEYKIMVNGHYGAYGKPRAGMSFIPDYDVNCMYREVSHQNMINATTGTYVNSVNVDLTQVRRIVGAPTCDGKK
jgi:hypothetical protein